MNDLDSWFTDGYVPERDYADMLREFMNEEVNGRLHNPMVLMHRIIDYHYAYMAAKERLLQLEGKVYALQETIDGPPEMET